MEWLNYHHLFYFWRIAREGGLARAAEQLHVTHSTLSTQLRSLEEFFGGALFERRGRRLVLTALGEEIASFADDIFRIGSELVDAARGRSNERRLALRIGVVSSMPKSVAYGLVEPALSVPNYGSIVARQDRLERLLEEMAAGRLHLVLSDVAPPEASAQRVFAHLLGESSLLLYGTPNLAKRCKKNFPESLEGAPLLVPTGQASLRRQLDRWLVQRGINVRIAGEFDDAGLMRIAGARGLGLLPVRAALRTEVEESYKLELVGPLTDVIESYYVISLERRVRHPAVSALIEHARIELALPSSTGTRAKGRPTRKKPAVRDSKAAAGTSPQPARLVGR
ncbi:MAG: LysR family transcriptional regulator [Polyangiaceae bacterium]